MSVGQYFMCCGSAPHQHKSKRAAMFRLRLLPLPDSNQVRKLLWSCDRKHRFSDKLQSSLIPERIQRRDY
jgi:hypothetical protein